MFHTYIVYVRDVLSISNVCFMLQVFDIVFEESRSAMSDRCTDGGRVRAQGGAMDGGGLLESSVASYAPDSHPRNGCPGASKSKKTHLYSTTTTSGILLDMC